MIGFRGRQLEILKTVLEFVIDDRGSQYQAPMVEILEELYGEEWFRFKNRIGDE
tara:strand:+ start:267 stop:428 length:162 start_codon:yes stop_codon:yes gene_type:complete